MTKARILADYVAGGTTATEFDYLDGLTSAAVGINDTQTLTNKTLASTTTFPTGMPYSATSSTGAGGLITEYGSYRVHTFLYEHSYTNFVLYTNKTCDVLMVGGGGGGANYNNTVGYGSGDSGEHTIFHNYIAYGGGGGGHGPGQQGGSGGGGGYQSPNTAGLGTGTATAGQGIQGYDGGAGHGTQAGGGGGGAGGAGTAAGSADPGEGGIGRQNSYRTGSNIYYAGGGAGG